jgi:tetratricopeptide (TPR) repeat protein
LIAQGNLTEAESHVPRFGSIEPTAESQAAVALVQSLGRRRDVLMKSLTPALAESAAGRAAADRAVCAESLFNDGRPTDWVSRLLDPQVFADVPIGPALGLRAVIAVHRGRLGPALRDAEQAIQLSPGQANGYRARGRIRLERIQPGGIEDLERAAELTSRADAGVLNDLAYGYFTLGRTQEAIAVQREALKIRPTTLSIRDQLRDFERMAAHQTKNPG